VPVHPLFDEGKEGCAVFPFDEEARERMALGVQGPQVAGVVSRREEAGQRAQAIPFAEEAAHERLVSLLPFGVLRQSCRPLVGPARDRRAEVVGEDGVRDLVRQAKGQQPQRRQVGRLCPSSSPLNVHANGASSGQRPRPAPRRAGSARA